MVWQWINLAAFDCQLDSKQRVVRGLAQTIESYPRHEHAHQTHRRDQSETKNRHDGDGPLPTDEPWPHGDRHAPSRLHPQWTQRVPASKETKKPVFVSTGACGQFSAIELFSETFLHHRALGVKVWPYQRHEAPLEKAGP